MDNRVLAKVLFLAGHLPGRLRERQPPSVAHHCFLSEGLHHYHATKDKVKNHKQQSKNRNITFSYPSSYHFLKKLGGFNRLYGYIE